MNITSSDSVTFCNENSETIQQVFVKCQKNTTFFEMHLVHVYFRNALKELGLIFVISFLVNTL